MTRNVSYQDYDDSNDQKENNSACNSQDCNRVAIFSKDCPDKSDKSVQRKTYNNICMSSKLEYSPDFSIVRTEVLLEFLTLPSSMMRVM